MKLRKQIGSAILATSMIITILPVNMSFTTASAEVTESIEMAETNIEEEIEDEKTTSIYMEEKVEETELEALSDTEETDIKITKITTSDIYYSVNEGFPMYVEYMTEESLKYSQRSALKLTVTKEDNTVIAQGNGYGYDDYFRIQNCNGIEAGKEYKLTFTITYTDSAGTEKTLLSESKQVRFEDKDAWSSCAYLPTEETSYGFTLYITTGAAISYELVDNVYLLDKNNEIAAGTIGNVQINNSSSSSDLRYQDIFKQKPYFQDWKYYTMRPTVYRTRKLEAGEILHAAYSIDGELYSLENTTFLVTKNPYITRIYNNSSYYAGEEDACVLSIEAKHTDFSKLSITLKEEETNEEVGYSIGVATTSKTQTYYTIKWKEGYQPVIYSNYCIEYSYADGTEVLSEEGERKLSFYSFDSYSSIWNPKTDTIEYYNKGIPTGISVSYEVWNGSKSSTNNTCIASGDGIVVNNDHLIEITLKKTFERTQTYYLYITYQNNEGTEITLNSSIWIYENKQAETSGEESYILIVQSLENRFYLSNNNKLTFSAGLYCNDESQLLAACKGVIENNTGSEVGSIDLKKAENSLIYQGEYHETLEAGRYTLSFKPDNNTVLSYTFYIENSEMACLKYQMNNIASGYIGLEFVSSEIADWYCGEENQNKWKVKLFDIQKQEIGTYQFSKDFTISGQSYYKTIQFADTVKEELTDLYFCYVYVYYDNKEVEKAIYESNSLPSISLYQESNSEAHYIRSETSNGWIYMLYNSNYYVQGKSTYKTITGSSSAFPATVTITDWYSLKPLKTITVEKSNYTFTESDLEGLSATKLYHCFLKGADGSASNYTGYLNASYGTPFWTSFSNFYPVSGDFDVTFEFTNKSAGTCNWENYLIVFANKFEVTSPIPNNNTGYKEYYVLRADKWGWSLGGYNENKTLEGNDVKYECSWNDDWDTFLNMIKDSQITMNIKRTGNDFVVDAKILGADSKEYTYVTRFTTAADNDMTIFFTNDYADVKILSFKDNKPSTETNSGNTTGNVYIPPIITQTNPPETPEQEEEETEEEEEEKQEEEKQEEQEPEQKEPEKETPEEDTNNTEESTSTTTQTSSGKLTLKKKTFTLKKGQKAQIKITSKLNTEVTYKSLKTTVATVTKKGVITAKKAGTAVITVKANGKKKKVTVTVKSTTSSTTSNSSVIKLKKNFKLSKSSTTIKKGAKLTIQKASGISGKVTFRSLNKKIASVSVNGVVKAKKKGKTTITIKNGSKTIKLKVTVNR